MSVKEEYLLFKTEKGLRTNNFNDRVVLQKFLRSRLGDIWKEHRKFSHGGLFKNYMTRLAIGFACYDCKPSSFCKTRCYGLRIAGVHEYNMLRLGVITSESLRIGDPRYLEPLSRTVRGLECLKIGHWGDGVLEQVPIIAKLVKDNPAIVFWWYTRKIEIALAANECELPNLRAYLSLDPSTGYPSHKVYPFDITYLVGDDCCHEKHEDILADSRLVAIFLLKKGRSIEDPGKYGLARHPKVCPEKTLRLKLGSKGHEICLSCRGRCNYRAK